MLITPSGIVMEVREVQDSNAYISSVVTLFGIVMDLSDEQFLNVLFPILVAGPSRVIIPCPS